MGRKIRNQIVQYFEFYCPACKTIHVVSDKQGFDVTGDINSPTITPSVKNTMPVIYQEIIDEKIVNKVNNSKICHCIVTGGKINYCPDCTHEFAGKTIEMIDL